VVSISVNRFYAISGVVCWNGEKDCHTTAQVVDEYMAFLPLSQVRTCINK
jgi:hypothetical protein